jgi:hypothetical protein
MRQPGANRFTMDKGVKMTPCIKATNRQESWIRVFHVQLPRQPWRKTYCENDRAKTTLRKRTGPKCPRQRIKMCLAVKITTNQKRPRRRLKRRGFRRGIQVMKCEIMHGVKMTPCTTKDRNVVEGIKMTPTESPTTASEKAGFQRGIKMTPLLKATKPPRQAPQLYYKC